MKINVDAQFTERRSTEGRHLLPSEGMYALPESHMEEETGSYCAARAESSHFTFLAVSDMDLGEHAFPEPMPTPHSLKIEREHRWRSTDTNDFALLMIWTECPELSSLNS